MTSPFSEYTWEEIAKTKETLVREFQKEVDEKKAVMVPSFIARMEEEHEIPPKVTVGTLRIWGMIHPDVSDEEYLERNSI